MTNKSKMQGKIKVRKQAVVRQCAIRVTRAKDKEIKQIIRAGIVTRKHYSEIFVLAAKEH